MVRTSKINTLRLTKTHGPGQGNFIIEIQNPLTTITRYILCSTELIKALYMRRAAAKQPKLTRYAQYFPAHKTNQNKQEMVYPKTEATHL